ncbi:Zn-dependent alcohol dehydrogenase [Parvibaculum indicum]|nr:hypothetical protein [Parvibaculum indicum]NIJ40860.1 Zn-dependent alcohol dehydrogenase [Parvibaculum indicum]
MKVTAAVVRSAENDFSIEETDLDEPRADGGWCAKVVHTMDRR